MGYESTFNGGDFSEDAVIENIERLNNEIKELSSGMSEAIIEKITEKDSSSYYSIDMDDYYGKFYDSEDFANLLSKYLVKGKADLSWTGEDGAIEAIRVIPNKTIDLINIMVPEYMIDGVRKYMDEYEKNKK